MERKKNKQEKRGEKKQQQQREGKIEIRIHSSSNGKVDLVRFGSVGFATSIYVTWKPHEIRLHSSWNNYNPNYTHQYKWPENIKYQNHWKYCAWKRAYILCLRPINFEIEEKTWERTLYTQRAERGAPKKHIWYLRCLSFSSFLICSHVCVYALNFRFLFSIKFPLLLLYVHHLKFIPIFE